MEVKFMEQSFKKAILFIGPGRSGKSRLANLILKGQQGAVTMDGRRFKIPALSKVCTADTKVVHIDDLNIKKHMEAIFSSITDGIVIIDKRGVTTTIRPQIIITAVAKMNDLPTGSSFDSRFDIFEVTKCN